MIPTGNEEEFRPVDAWLQMRKQWKTVPRKSKKTPKICHGVSSGEMTPFFTKTASSKDPINPLKWGSKFPAVIQRYKLHDSFIHTLTTFPAKIMLGASWATCKIN